MAREMQRRPACPVTDVAAQRISLAKPALISRVKTCELA